MTAARISTTSPPAIYRTGLPMHRYGSFVFSLLTAFVILLGVSLVGCQKDSMPQLIQVLDLAPHEAEVGDRLEVLGSGFPHGKTAHLVFRGNLNRPGERP